MEVRRPTSCTDAWKCSASIIKNSPNIKPEHKVFGTDSYTELRNRIAGYIINNQDKLMPNKNTVTLATNVFGDAFLEKTTDNISTKNKSKLSVPNKDESTSFGKSQISYMNVIRENYSTDQANAFEAELQSFCKKHNIQPNDLMTLMALETQESFLTTQPNAANDAFGLIQFTQIAADDIRVPFETIKQASLVQQFKYAEMFLEKQAKNQGKQLSDLNREDLYLLILYPEGIIPSAIEFSVSIFFTIT